MNKIRIGLDIDGTLGDFYGSYSVFFNAERNPKVLENRNITKNVVKLKTNKDFWLGLPKIEDINFEPELYCTKRIHPKTWSRQWLVNNGFPDKPIYQLVCQLGNKASLIKGRCDVLVDDSVYDVVSCIKSGLPALLIDRPHNRWFGPEFRVFSLDEDEIREAYDLFMGYDYEYLNGL